MSHFLVNDVLNGPGTACNRVCDLDASIHKYMLQMGEHAVSDRSEVLARLARYRCADASEVVVIRTYAAGE